MSIPVPRWKRRSVYGALLIPLPTTVRKECSVIGLALGIKAGAVFALTEAQFGSTGRAVQAEIFETVDGAAGGPNAFAAAGPTMVVGLENLRHQPHLSEQRLNVGARGFHQQPAA